MARLSMLDKLLNAIKKEYYAIGIFDNHRKAFHIIDHIIRLYTRILMMGVSLHWIDSF